VPLTPQLDGDDIVSPELVLVDPELAQRVRPTALTGTWTPAVHAASVRFRSPAPSRPLTANAETLERAKKRSARPILIAAVAACLVVLGALVVTRRATTDSNDTAGSAPGPPALPTPTIESPTLPPATPATPKVKTSTTPSPTRSRVAWRPARFATFYNVVFMRDGDRKLQLWTAHTELSIRLLRSGKGLRAGRYRWFVRPGYGNPRLRKVPGRTFYGPVTSRGVLVVRRTS
jgi:hypothetical protein